MMRSGLTLAEYFKSRTPAAASKRPAAPMPFVTISRETGAGSSALAEALVARLSKEKGPVFSGWSVFDQNLCKLVASDPKLRVSLDSLVNEEFHEGLEDYFRSVFADESSQRKINNHVFETVRSLCSLGKAIIIGRAAALVTRDLPLGIHVRLVSNRDDRLQRLVRETGVGAAAARKIMSQRDAQRARMVMSNFRRDIADPLLYDCVWNTSAASFEEIAEALTALIHKRAAAPR